MRKWLLALTVLHIFDTMITWANGVANEGNPLVVYIWDTYGFAAWVGIKLAALLALMAGVALAGSLGNKALRSLAHWSVGVSVAAAAALALRNIALAVC